MESNDFRQTYYRYLRYFLAKDESTATSYDKYMSLVYSIRHELTDNWIKTHKKYATQNVRRVYYLSMEYIFGKSLYQNILNLGIKPLIEETIGDLGFSLEDIYKQEDDFELGNSGKGRMAASYLDSMSTLGIPAMAYGLRYDYAQFQQSIHNGLQIERPYDWLHRGHPWEIIRPEYACAVNFAGSCSIINPTDTLGAYAWDSGEQVHAIPYDVPITGYKNDVVNTLRLWSARASEEFLPDYANHGDYARACEEKSQLGRITKILFPEEDVRRATEIRMKQQYFFISATLQDIIRRYKVLNTDIRDFDKKVIIHLNGSRCALAIPELMRILIDCEKVPWDKAWQITSNVFSYTSHAMTKDHLESWPVYKVTQMLPRHMQIVFDINQIHLENIRRSFSSDPEIVRELSLIEEGEVKRIRLANLAALGSFSVNGISRPQTEILSRKLFPVHTQFYPDKFRNITTGIAHRRWLLCANPPLSSLITDAIGSSWHTDAEKLQLLEDKINDRQFLEKLAQVKTNAKQIFSDFLTKQLNISVDPTFMFDTQIGKIHPYKRQVLHLLFILHCYLQIKSGKFVGSRRVHIFSGKASPSDFLAKQIIHLISLVANIVNKDPDVSKFSSVVFIPNFGMTQAERIVPAADLSEQLSTASLEAAGTFNMKFAFNGTLTIASRCGTNIELAEKIGEQACLIFGKDAEELQAMQAYKPYELAESDTRLKAIFKLLDEMLPTFSDGNMIYPLLSSLRDTDRFFVLLDFDDYVKQQEQIDRLYTDRLLWTKDCLLSIARSSHFSSDRAVTEYARTIWKV
jgi:glycogen phosphorylase